MSMNGQKEQGMIIYDTDSFTEHENKEVRTGLQKAMLQ